MTISPSLSALLAPTAVDAFLADYWPERPLHVPGEAGRFIELLGIPELRDFDTFERAWRHEAFVLPPTGGDESLGAAVHGPAIRRLFDAGLPMFLHRPERQYPELAAWLAALRRELGIPACARMLCSAHASPGGTTTEVHFDQAISFILQLSGTKRWVLAPNASSPWPTQRYSLAMPALHGELARYREAPLPQAMPADAMEVTLGPGSLLFVPSGWWHSTVGIGPSLALMFITINLNWAEVVTAALRRKLIGDQSWRRFAAGARSCSPAHRATAVVEARALLAELPTLVTSLDAEEVVEPLYLRVPETTCRVSDGVASFTSARHHSKVELGGAELALLADLERRGAATARELVAAGHPPALVEALLAALVEVELFTVE